jgi:uncharacterized protein (UPF0335 family)
MAKAKTTKADGVNRDALGRFISRLEIHYEERKGLNETIRGVYEEIRQAGMDAETVRVMVKERGLDPQIRHDQYAIRDEYRRALGLYADTPLGQAMEPGVREEEALSKAEAAVKSRQKSSTARKPRPFAEQPVHPPQRGRGRPRKTVDEAFAEARAHLGEPVGTA